LTTEEVFVIWFNHDWIDWFMANRSRYSSTFKTL